MTVMPDQPKPGDQPDAPERGDVEEINERDTNPPHEIAEPEFDDGGDGEPPKRGKKR